MDHASRENIFDELTNFEKKKPSEVPTILEEYLELIAKTGDILFSWAKLKPLFKHKLDKVIVKFNEDYPAKELPFSPNMEKFNYEEMHSKLLNAVDEFSGAPFTIQRLCELVVSPDKHYKRIDKFMRALEKDLLVVSTIEPLCKRQKLDSDNLPLVNGVVVDGNNSHNGSAESPPRSGDVDVQSLDESTADAILNPGEGSGDSGEAISKQEVTTNGNEPVQLENGQASASSVASTDAEQMETTVSSSSALSVTNGLASTSEEIKVNGEAAIVDESSKPILETAESSSQVPSTTENLVSVETDQQMEDVSSDQPQSTSMDQPEPSTGDNLQPLEADKSAALVEAAVASTESSVVEQPQSTVSEQKVADSERPLEADAGSLPKPAEVEQPAHLSAPDDAIHPAVVNPELPQSSSSTCEEPESSAADPEVLPKEPELSSANEQEPLSSSVLEQVSPAPAEQPLIMESLPVTTETNQAASELQVATTSEQVASQSTDSLVVAAAVDTKESEAEVKQPEADTEALKSEVAIEKLSEKSEENKVISSTEDVDTPASPDQPKDAASVGDDTTSPLGNVADSQEAEKAATGVAVDLVTAAATAECEEMDCKDDEPDSTPEITTPAVQADQPAASGELPVEPCEAEASVDAPEPMDED